MNDLVRTIAKRLLVGVGTVVIALALVIGAFRLLIAQLPGYQEELRAWVTAELGVDAEFGALDARLGLYGPELDLRQVRLRVVGVDRAFLEAGRARLTVDPWALLVRRRVAISRLTVDGASLGVERIADGTLRIQGLPTAIGERSDLSAMLPESVDIVVRDSSVLYIDRPARRSWQFTGVELAVDRGPGRSGARGRARPPAELGTRFEFAASRATPDDTATVEVSIDGVDLAAAARMLPAAGRVAAAGHGDIDFEAHWTAGRLLRAKADVAVEALAIGAEGGGPDYDRLGFSAEWVRGNGDSWALALDALEIERGGHRWPAGTRATLGRGNGVVDLTADFVRIEDLAPLVRRFAPAGLVDRWQSLAPRGDIDRLELTTDADGPVGAAFGLEAEFRGLAVAAAAGLPGFDAIDGEIRAGAGTGTVSFASTGASVAWPGLLDGTVGGGTLRGTVVWRRGQEGLRVVSDDLRFDVFGVPLVASFDLGLPAGDGGPDLDLHGRLGQITVADAKRLLPRRIMPGAVTRWLDGALGSGMLDDVEIELTGPLAAFPFDGGEGHFLVTAHPVDATLDFIEGWPRAEDLVGELRFENASFLATGAGRVLSSSTQDVRVAIADMRTPVLEVDADVAGPLTDVLEFVQTAPLIAHHLGPGFDRLDAMAGEATTGLDLDISLRDFSDYTLSSRIGITAGGLRIEGFGPEASDIDGTLEVMNSTVSGEGISAVFLGGPVTATVAPATRPGYRTELTVSGETTTDSVLGAFSLPFRDLVDGQTLWSGRLLLPRVESEDPGPLRVEVDSNLSGVALRLPDPVAKTPGEPVNLRLGFEFGADDSLSLAGNLGATRRFEFLFDRNDDSFELSRGAVAFGGDEPRLPLRDGIVVSGRVPTLDLDEWFDVTKSSNIDQARPLFYSAALEIGDFVAFGQRLGETTLDVQRGDRIWAIDVDSAAIAGRIEVPQDLRSRAPVIADMARVYLAVGDEPAELGGVDPQRLPGLRLRAAEFGLGSRGLGQVEADVVAEPMGLRLTSFTSHTPSFELEATGSWLADGGDSVTRIAATVSSSDVGATLEELGIDRIVEAETGELTASVYWNGPPASTWLDHLNGDVALSVDTGSLVDLDPGAGRVVGLMSIAALPRRLMLDFRDVFSKGFTFDEITGSFMIDDGNAYTDNLKLSGPAAEIGVIGRTGLRDRDYQQQAVVTAEPSNMLPTVGGLLGGPGVGAALLIFTRIFKESLKGIGRASYCVTGHWDAPVVERIESDHGNDDAGQCVSMPDFVAETTNGG